MSQSNNPRCTDSYPFAHKNEHPFFVHAELDLAQQRLQQKLYQSYYILKVINFMVLIFLQAKNKQVIWEKSRFHCYTSIQSMIGMHTYKAKHQKALYYVILFQKLLVLYTPLDLIHMNWYSGRQDHLLCTRREEDSFA